MKTVLIESIALKASVLSLGLGDIGAGISEPDSYRLLDAYLDGGGNFLDTARIYSDWIPGETGRSERVLGDWLALRGSRQRVVLATKGAHFYLDGLRIPRMSRQEMEADLNLSLQALRTDTIDLYYLHRDDRSRPVEEILGNLEDFARAGKIRRYACSNWRADRMLEAHAAARANGFKGFAANQIFWNLGTANCKGNPDDTCETFNADMRGAFERTGMLAVAYSSQAGGYFTKLDRGSAVPGGIYDTPGNRRVYARAREMAAEAGMSITDIVLAYILSQPIPTAAVVGCKTVEQLVESMLASEKPLSAQMLGELEAVVAQK